METKTIWNKKLDEIKSKKELVCIFSDTDNTDKFSVGEIIGFDNDFILLKKISPEGNLDGFTVYLKEYVYSIEFSNKYLQRFKVLTIKKDNKYTEIQEKLKSNFRFDELIQLGIKQNIILSINSIYDRNFTGLIKEFDDESVVIENKEDFGESDGYSIFKLDEIEKISLFEIEQKCIK